MSVLVLLGMLAGLGCGGASERKAMPLAKDGIIDLRNWDFEKDGIVELNGQWRFVWEEFVEPMPSEVFRSTHKGTIEVPFDWKNQPHPTKSGAFLPALGFCTYVLQIQLPRGTDAGTLALKTGIVANAGFWQISSRDGSQILGTMTQGAPGISKESTTPFRIRESMEVSSSDSQILMVWVHVSNFNSAGAGMWRAVDLGPQNRIAQVEAFIFLLNAAIFGVLAIIALYHLVLFLQRREDTPSLYFAFFCTAVALRQWVTSRFSQELGLGASVEGFELLQRLEYVSMPLSTATAGLFILALVPGRFFKRFIYGYAVGLAAVLVLLTLLVNPLVFTNNLYLYQLYILGGAVVVLVYLAYRGWYGDLLARGLWLAFGGLAIGTVNDILVGQELIKTALIVPYTFIAFILLQSGILSGVAARAHRKAEHLSENLQKEVEAQTNDLTLKTQEALVAKSESDRLRTKAESARHEAEKAKEESELLRKEAEEHAVELKELDQHKTAFFQNMSHELRTPLTLILNPLEEVSAEQPEEKRLEVASKNSRRLLRLVNQLLDFQKLEAGKQELKLIPINLSQFAHVCGDYFASACSTKEIEFSATLSGQAMDEKSTPVYFLGEVDSLEKVVFNFLSNALKYTPKGGQIQLALTATADKVRLSIRDTGPGISEEGQQKLFQVFSQLDETTTRDYEGTGLGLALVKSLAEEMNGEVGVESEVGKGSTFWVEFPLIKRGRASVALLFVDDDELVRDSFFRQFSIELGAANVKVVASAKEAREILKTTDVSCIISDSRMPEEDGPSFLTFVYNTYPNIGRILFTGEEDHELLRAAVKEARVHEIIYKPFSVMQIRASPSSVLS